VKRNEQWSIARVARLSEEGRVGEIPLPVVEEVAKLGLMVMARLTAAPVGHEAKRTCGDCRACCSALGIEESPGEKELGLISEWSAPGEPCRYECDKGCRDYARRPLSCRAYLCWWLRGWGKEQDRPDRSGLIFDNQISQEMALLFGGVIPIVMVAETKPGVFPPKGAMLGDFPLPVIKLATERLVLLRYWRDLHPSEAFGPDPLIKRMREIEERWKKNQEGKVT
jgi:hypothetical protein